MQPTFVEAIAKESKDDYYKDNSSVSFSDVKVFSRCETLYRDQKILKTYEEPEQDYFVYGKLVDALVSESAEFVAETFVRVERKIKVENALRYEGDIQRLEDEILGLSEKVQAGNKTAIKGVEKRMSDIEDLKEKLNVIKFAADKTQVTNSIWEESQETAAAIKAHPSYATMEWNAFTSQQVFRATIRGIPRRGKLDHLKLSPAIHKFYAIYKANQMTLEELQERVRSLNDDDVWAKITDVKTCADLAKLEPYNNHYRGQLGYYRELVSEVLAIPINRIACFILVCDKVSNRRKKAELFVYTQSALDEIKTDVETWVHKWLFAVTHNAYVSAKIKHGMKQKCFTCSDCSFCPFAATPGEPVVIDGPRFGTSDAPGYKIRPGMKEIIDAELEDEQNAEEVQ